jgi:hypothetical protein
MSEAEVVYQIREIWPEIGEHASYALWNRSSFPLYEGDDPLSYWLTQIARYLDGDCEEDA